ncbi:unnamed protein product, partial [Amoebophrya sp. A120]
FSPTYERSYQAFCLLEKTGQFNSSNYFSSSSTSGFVSPDGEGAGTGNEKTQAEMIVQFERYYRFKKAVVPLNHATDHSGNGMKTTTDGQTMDDGASSTTFAAASSPSGISPTQLQQEEDLLHLLVARKLLPEAREWSATGGGGGGSSAGTASN